MKRISYLIIICMFLTIIAGATTFADSDRTVNISINGEYVEFNDDLGYPFVDSNSRTQVPFRVTLEKLGAKVSWDGENNRAVAEKDDIKIEVPIGEKYIYKNGEKIVNDTKALIKNGRTYLPIRIVMEAFGCKVDWDGEYRTVTIKDTEKHYVEMDFTEVFLKKRVKVTYKEKITGTKKLSYDVAWEGDVDFISVVEPFVNDGKGKYEIKSNERKVNFILNGESEYVEYGYYYVLDKGVMPLGYILNDIGYVGIRNVLDGSFVNNNGYYLTIIKSHDIDVYTPYELVDSEKNIYYIPQSNNVLNSIWKGGTLIFGNFDNKEEHYFDNHTLTILSNGLDENHISIRLSEFVYKKMINEVFKNNSEYLNKNCIILYVTEPYDYLRAEGYRGAQIEKIGEFDTVPRKVINGDPYGMFIDYPNMKSIGRLYVHQTIHATFDDEFTGWWSIEGIAEYMMPLMLKEYGILTEEQSNEVYMDLISFYNEKIVAKDIDIPMYLIMDSKNSVEELESKYDIEINTDELRHDEINELNAGKDYKWTYDEENTSWFIYKKGALVFLYLDQYIQQHTDGKKDIFDLLNSYLLRKKEEGSSYELIESVVSNLTNTNFTGFFEKYIMDNEPLPLKVVDGKIVVK